MRLLFFPKFPSPTITFIPDHTFIRDLGVPALRVLSIVITMGVEFLKLVIINAILDLQRESPWEKLSNSWCLKLKASKHLTKLESSFPLRTTFDFVCPLKALISLFIQKMNCKIRNLM